MPFRQPETQIRFLCLFGFLCLARDDLEGDPHLVLDLHGSQPSRHRVDPKISLFELTLSSSLPRWSNLLEVCMNGYWSRLVPVRQVAVDKYLMVPLRLDHRGFKAYGWIFFDAQHALTLHRRLYLFLSPTESSGSTTWSDFASTANSTEV